MDEDRENVQIGAVGGNFLVVQEEIQKFFSRDVGESTSTYKVQGLAGPNDLIEIVVTVSACIKIIEWTVGKVAESFFSKIGDALAERILGIFKNSKENIMSDPESDIKLERLKALLNFVEAIDGDVVLSCNLAGHSIRKVGLVGVEKINFFTDERILLVFSSMERICAHIDDINTYIKSFKGFDENSRVGGSIHLAENGTIEMKIYVTAKPHMTNEEQNKSFESGEIHAIYDAGTGNFTIVRKLHSKEW